MATPVLAFKGALAPPPHNSSNVNWEALFWTIGILVVVTLWFGVLWVTRRQNVRSAASHASIHRRVPPLDETLDFQPASQNPSI